MAARRWTVFLTSLVLFNFMEETKLAMACKETLMSVTVCENDKAIIRCLKGGNIKIVEASYGRHDRNTCPHSSIHTTNCHARNSLAVVQSRCDNKASCELDSSNRVFGDPCGGTYKYLEVKFQCVLLQSVTICEGNQATLSCQSGRRFSVLEASYGRHDRNTCPHSSIRTTNCHAGKSLAIVKGRCDNKASCKLQSSNSVFGDPCWGTYKYLEVKYQCVLPADISRSITICEGNQGTLSCQSGRKISVIEASYGRHDRNTCPHSSIHTTNCHAGNSLSIVKGRCNNRASCKLQSSNSVFGDPCGGTYKYLEVKYQCI